MSSNGLRAFILNVARARQKVSLRQFAKMHLEKNEKQPELLCDFFSELIWICSTSDFQLLDTDTISLYSWLYGYHSKYYEERMIRFVSTIQSFRLEPVFFVECCCLTVLDCPVERELCHLCLVRVRDNYSSILQVCLGQCKLCKVQWSLREGMVHDMISALGSRHKVKMDEEMLLKVTVESISTVAKASDPPVFIDSKGMKNVAMDSVLVNMVKSAENAKKSTKCRKLGGRLCKVNTKLPILEHRKKILELIRDYTVTCIEVKTGCGKSTMVLQFILDESLNQPEPQYYNVIITQPRRVGAIKLAERVAAERQEPVGKSIGYCVGGDIHRASHTKVTYCTIGYFVQVLVHNPSAIQSYTHIILDEVHERSMDTDFAMLVVRRLLSARQRTQIILMSATLQGNMLTKYFEETFHFSLVSSPYFVGAKRYPVKQCFYDDLSDLADKLSKIQSLLNSMLRRTPANLVSEIRSPNSFDMVWEVVRFGFHSAVDEDLVSENGSDELDDIDALDNQKSYNCDEFYPPMKLAIVSKAVINEDPSRNSRTSSVFSSQSDSVQDVYSQGNLRRLKSDFKLSPLAKPFVPCVSNSDMSLATASHFEDEVSSVVSRSLEDEHLSRKVNVSENHTEVAALSEVASPSAASYSDHSKVLDLILPPPPGFGPMSLSEDHTEVAALSEVAAPSAASYSDHSKFLDLILPPPPGFGPMSLSEDHTEVAALSEVAAPSAASYSDHSKFLDLILPPPPGFGPMSLSVSSEVHNHIDNRSESIIGDECCVLAPQCCDQNNENSIPYYPYSQAPCESLSENVLFGESTPLTNLSGAPDIVQPKDDQCSMQGRTSISDESPLVSKSASAHNLNFSSGHDIGKNTDPVAESAAFHITHPVEEPIPAPCRPSGSVLSNLRQALLDYGIPNVEKLDAIMKTIEQIKGTSEVIGTQEVVDPTSSGSSNDDLNHKTNIGNYHFPSASLTQGNSEKDLLNSRSHQMNSTNVQTEESHDNDTVTEPKASSTEVSYDLEVYKESNEVSYDFAVENSVQCEDDYSSLAIVHPTLSIVSQEDPTVSLVSQEQSIVPLVSQEHSTVPLVSQESGIDFQESTASQNTDSLLVDSSLDGNKYGAIYCSSLDSGRSCSTACGSLKSGDSWPNVEQEVPVAEHTSSEIHPSNNLSVSLCGNSATGSSLVTTKKQQPPAGASASRKSSQSTSPLSPVEVVPSAEQDRNIVLKEVSKVIQQSMNNRIRCSQVRRRISIGLRPSERLDRHFFERHSSLFEIDEIRYKREGDENDFFVSLVPQRIVSSHPYPEHSRSGKPRGNKTRNRFQSCRGQGGAIREDNEVPTAHGEGSACVPKFSESKAKGGASNHGEDKKRNKIKKHKIEHFQEGVALKDVSRRHGLRGRGGYRGEPRYVYGSGLPFYCSKAESDSEL